MNPLGTRTTRRVGVWLALALVVSGPIVPAGADTPPAGAHKRLVGFYASWSAYGPYQVTRIPGQWLTHVEYAFATVGRDQRVALGDPAVDPKNIAGLMALKRRYPHLTVMLAVGGAGSGSQGFSAMARTSAGRARFAASCARLLTETYPQAFDGLTIDWEYPGGDGHAVPGDPSDRANLTALLTDLRRALDVASQKRHKRLQLATALGAGSEYLPRYELAAVGRAVDYIDFMTFEYASGGTRSGHNAPLYGSGGDCVDRSVSRLRQAGVPADRINLALPFFGQSWRTTATGRTHGLGMPARQTGSLTYGDIAKILPKGTHQRHWDAVGRVPFLTAPPGAWISYDDPQSLAQKAQYVQAQGLGGAFIWHLGADDPAHTLLSTAWRQLSP